MKNRLREIERRLEEQGIRPDIRKAIRAAKICIIDDKISDLRSLVDGLEREGFTHLVQLQSVKSIHDIVSGQYQLVILDLTGVAQHISDLDGIGVLSALKKTAPELPVLVVTGSATTADLVKEASKADAIRSKPIKSAELASEVDDILKVRCDPYWAGLRLLRDLGRHHKDLSAELPWLARIRLSWHEQQLLRDLERSRPTAVRRIVSIAGVLSGVPEAAGIVMSMRVFLNE